MKAICYQCKQERNTKDLDLYNYENKTFYCCVSCRYDLIEYQRSPVSKAKKLDQK